MEHLMTQKEFAAYIGVSYNKLIQMRQNGEVTMSKIGGRYKISEADAKLFYEKQKQAVIVPPAQRRTRHKKIYMNRVEPVNVNKNGVAQYV